MKVECPIRNIINNMLVHIVLTFRSLTSSNFARHFNLHSNSTCKVTCVLPSLGGKFPKILLLVESLLTNGKLKSDNYLNSKFIALEKYLWSLGI